MSNLTSLHGMPDSIVLDRDAKSAFLICKHLKKRFGIKLKMITRYHPQMDKSSNVANRVLKDYLHCYYSEL